MSKNGPIVIAGIVAVAGVIVFVAVLSWEGLTMKVSLDQLTTLLGPIAFAAAVIERGVEILISPWRDAGANKLESTLAAAKASGDVVKAKQASDELDDYRGTTQRYAFVASLILAILVSISGVRAFQPFLDADKFKALLSANPLQHNFFLCVDAALSAVLLAGGADGVHSVVNAVTTFFDSTASKAAKS